jgi:hypothetical protein
MLQNLPYKKTQIVFSLKNKVVARNEKKTKKKNGFFLFKNMANFESFC